MYGLLYKFKQQLYLFGGPAQGEGLQGALDMGIKVLGNKGSPPPTKTPTLENASEEIEGPPMRVAHPSAGRRPP